MKTDWTKNLRSDDERIKFENSLRSAKTVLDRLTDILNEYEKSLDRSETSVEIYDLPNWDYRQAHKNGYRACLNRIKELVATDK